MPIPVSTDATSDRACLTVQDVIDRLLAIDDKTLPVFIQDRVEESLSIVDDIILSDREKKPYIKGFGPFDDEMYDVRFTRAVVLTGNN